MREVTEKILKIVPEILEMSSSTVWIDMTQVTKDLEFFNITSKFHSLAFLCAFFDSSDNFM